MNSGAYYNEIDPKAAAWLRELIKTGEIAPGIVDERDIRDILPDELAGYAQCHFFAGIGGWSLALRLAGWPDDQPVWTGSCPCQPFSPAGKRGGTDDERHLWPAFFHLIDQRRPPVVFGEQVASKDGLGWFDLVSADLEGSGYTVGAADLCAAGVGAPHIRQRLWFVGLANPADARLSLWGFEPGAEPGSVEQSERLRVDDGLADAAGTRSLPCTQPGIYRGQEGTGPWDAEPERHSSASRVEHATGDGRVEWRAKADGRGAASGRGLGGLADRDDAGLEGRGQPGRERAAERPAGPSGVACGLGNASSPTGEWDAGSVFAPEAREHGAREHGAREHGARQPVDGRLPVGPQHASAGMGSRQPGPVNGVWRDADWLYCRDGKWRPVEPGTFPLAHGIPGRVGLLRGYGNAIVPAAAQAFIEASLEALDDVQRIRLMSVSEGDIFA